MLEHIRHAISLIRTRHSPKGKHRRPRAPLFPPASPAPRAPVDDQTLTLTAPVRTRHQHLLRGEDVALVRPYVLAQEHASRAHPSIVIAPHVPADARTALLGPR
ncbi:hypothetical protein GCM10018772_04620 [Streptomyces fumanus]|uniref:Uncharacterized protein n=1 Tax=Streptomyces fumanus TaxID=67302 RepID=A0A919DVX8_9ACTN|nr:hypothetical protein GCM10018772_04620 [Streptomyces fumanus]